MTIANQQLLIFNVYQVTQKKEKLKKKIRKKERGSKKIRYHNRKTGTFKLANMTG